MKTNLIPLLCCAGLSILLGCERAPTPTVTYEQIVNNLNNIDQIADLSQISSQLISSWDRTGGNNDFSQFLRDGPPGWKVLADIKGSGYISRSWFTGAKNGNKKIRFYLEGEKKPRFETTLTEWCGKRGNSDQLPLRGYQPYCWFSWVPVSFSKQLIIMQEEPIADEKLFYQINVNLLPEGEIAESWHPRLLEKNTIVTSFQELNKRWVKTQSTDTSSFESIHSALSGTETKLWHHEGSGIIKAIRILPQWPNELSIADRERLLRSLVIRVYWDGSAEPSIDVPLGPLCGNLWSQIHYGSAYFGSSSGVFRLSFPMPFRKGAMITVLNQDNIHIPLAIDVKIDDTVPADSLGYFHASWRKSTAAEIGSPHVILQTTGRGKYVGTILGVRSLDQSFWVLESDEEMFIDNNQEPSWRGTGLEDYFNGGWYYANALADPFHGIVFKAPYRTIQYRLHLSDPVQFNNAFKMTFERGPNHASRAEMDSVAFYYMKVPQVADSALGEPSYRFPVADPNEPYSLMTEVNNLERLGDVSGAIDRLKAFLDLYADFPFRDTVLQRIKNYTNPPPIQDGQAILGVYANTKVRVFLDGKLVANVNDPSAQRVRFRDISLPAGQHTLALEYVNRPYPDFAQLMLEYPEGFIGTDNTWKFMFNPPTNWSAADYDDSSWLQHNDIWVKGPPEEPHVWCEPHDRPFTQSRAWGLMAPIDWPPEKGIMALRKTFHVPESNFNNSTKP